MSTSEPRTDRTYEQKSTHRHPREHFQARPLDEPSPELQIVSRRKVSLGSGGPTKCQDWSEALSGGTAPQSSPSRRASSSVNADRTPGIPISTSSTGSTASLGQFDVTAAPGLSYVFGSGLAANLFSIVSRALRYDLGFARWRRTCLPSFRRHHWPLYVWGVPILWMRHVRPPQWIEY